MININTFMKIFYAVGLEMNVYGDVFILYFIDSITIFLNSLVSLALHNSRLPLSYLTFAVRKPENANSTFRRVAGKDEITGTNCYSSCLDIFESFSASVSFLYFFNSYPCK